MTHDEWKRMQLARKVVGVYRPLHDHKLFHRDYTDALIRYKALKSMFSAVKQSNKGKHEVLAQKAIADASICFGKVKMRSRGNIEIEIGQPDLKIQDLGYYKYFRFKVPLTFGRRVKEPIYDKGFNGPLYIMYADELTVNYKFGKLFEIIAAPKHNMKLTSLYLAQKTVGKSAWVWGPNAVDVIKRLDTMVQKEMTRMLTGEKE